MGHIKLGTQHTSQEHLDANTWVSASRLCSLFQCDDVHQLFSRFPRLNGLAVQTPDGARWCMSDVRPLLPSGGARSIDDVTTFARTAADASPQPTDLIDRAEVERLCGPLLDLMRSELVKYSRSHGDGTLRWMRDDVEFLLQLHAPPVW